MKVFRKTSNRWLLGITAVALVAVLSLVAVIAMQPAANAAPVSSAVSQAATPAPTSSAASDFVTARDSFVKDFAAQLGVDEAKLNSAFSKAVGDSVDQAVKDGKLKPELANKIKDLTKDGFKSIDPSAIKAGMTNNGSFPNMAGAEQLFKPIMDATAGALGMTGDQLQTELKSGKSIAAIAASKNVDLQKVKDAMLAASKQQIDAVAKFGVITQPQADKVYQTVQLWIDEIVNFAPKTH